MTDPQALVDQAETIAAQRQQAKDRRTAAAAVGFLLLLLFASLWLALSLGLAVRLFSWLAWGG